MRELKWAAVLLGIMVVGSYLERATSGDAMGPKCSDDAAVAAACTSAYPSCVIPCAYKASSCGHDWKTGEASCSCPSGQYCNKGTCEAAVGDMATVVGEPTCTPPGTVSCSSGAFFASATVSGCFTGDPPPNSIPDPVSQSAMCTGYNIVQCNAGCSFCLDKSAAIPTGCHKCDSNNPC
jgi:hypothetical protein